MSRQHQRIPAARWKRLRCQVFKRDKYRCQRCGQAGKLECDHIIPLDLGGKALDPENLQALCRFCHMAKTARENKHRAVSVERQKWRDYLKGLV